jgi:hypothetical protein
MRKAQASMEFLILTAFMLIFFLIITIGIQHRMYIAHLAENEKIASELASVINNEAILASSVHDGYEREFLLPVLIDGANYSLQLYDNQDLFIYYRGSSYLFFLDANMTNTTPLRAGYVTIKS